jgi:hypothetical protein
MVPENPSLIPLGDRRAVVCWIMKVCRRASVQDRSVFFFAVQIVDYYIQRVRRLQPSRAIDVQLLGIVALFMATKLLEVTYFDMAFCHKSLGHFKYSELQIIEVESELTGFYKWDYTKYTQVDFHHLLVGMLKCRLPARRLSTILFKAVTVELDEKLLIDLRQTLCVESLLQMRPLLKVAGMLTYKLENLVSFIARDFPSQAAAEMGALRHLWVCEVVSGRLLMKGQDLYAIGAYIFQELHTFRVEVGISVTEQQHLRPNS